jgi:hypothetical protein
MITKYTTWPKNIQNGSKIDRMTKKITSQDTKIYPNWDFWFENIPSGNPVSHCEQDDQIVRLFILGSF